MKMLFMFGFLMSHHAMADAVGNPIQNASDSDGGISLGAVLVGTAILVAVWYFFDKKK
jgi:hypothetical protein